MSIVSNPQAVFPISRPQRNMPWVEFRDGRGYLTEHGHHFLMQLYAAVMGDDGLEERTSTDTGLSAAALYGVAQSDLDEAVRAATQPLPQVTPEPPVERFFAPAQQDPDPARFLTLEALGGAPENRPTFIGWAQLPSYTVTTVPAAGALNTGALIYVTDETGGAVPAFSDGTNWRRVTDRAVIS